VSSYLGRGHQAHRHVFLPNYLRAECSLAAVNTHCLGRGHQIRGTCPIIACLELNVVSQMVLLTTLVGAIRSVGKHTYAYLPITLVGAIRSVGKHTYAYLPITLVGAIRSVVRSCRCRQCLPHHLRQVYTRPWSRANSRRADFQTRRLSEGLTREGSPTPSPRTRFRRAARRLSDHPCERDCSAKIYQSVFVHVANPAIIQAMQIR
jgi:hypothetical protein